MVFQTLRVANEAGKQQARGTSVEDLEGLMSELRAQQLEQDEVGQMFVDNANIGVDQSDEDLMRELEQLEQSETDSMGQAHFGNKVGG